MIIIHTSFINVGLLLDPQLFARVRNWALTPPFLCFSVPFFLMPPLFLNVFEWNEENFYVSSFIWGLKKVYRHKFSLTQSKLD